LKKNNVLVLADEIYARLTYGEQFVSMAKVSNETMAIVYVK